MLIKKCSIIKESDIFISNNFKNSKPRLVEENKVKIEAKRIIHTFFPKNMDFFIAGGMLTSLFANQEINDIDVFFSSSKDYENLYDYFINKKWQKSQTDKAVTFYIDKKLSKTVIQKIQLIKKFMSPEETIKRFDFTVCSIAYIPKENKIIKNESSLSHIKNRILVINDGKNLWLSYKRIRKYIVKGYKFNGNLQSFCSRCHHRLFCLSNNTKRCTWLMSEYNF